MGSLGAAKSGSFAFLPTAGYTDGVSHPRVLEMPQEFPQTLYVTAEHEGDDDTYYVANEYLQDIPEDQHEAPVAEYRLVKVGKMAVTKEIINA